MRSEGHVEAQRRSPTLRSGRSDINFRPFDFRLSTLRLQETEFSESFVLDCDLSDADLTGASFESGGFEKNTITNAVLKDTSFNAMYIADIVFGGTVEDCFFENCAFKKVTFQNSTLINTFFKSKNKSLKGIRFVDCRADKLTCAFLKSGKADLNGITLITS